MKNLTKFQKWIIGVCTVILILGLFALVVYIAGLCKDLTWVEMFKQMFGIGKQVVETPNVSENVETVASLIL